MYKFQNQRALAKRTSQIMQNGQDPNKNIRTKLLFN